jgi:ATPase family AAA domain-containing protein 3A/B
MQEASALRREEARRATEQKILEEMIRTEKEKAEIDQEVNRAKALAEAEARVHEEKQSEEVTKRMMLERMKGEKEKWLAAINTTFSHIEGFGAFFISNFYEVNLPLSLECPRQ